MTLGDVIVNSFDRFLVVNILFVQENGYYSIRLWVHNVVILVGINAFHAVLFFNSK